MRVEENRNKHKTRKNKKGVACQDYRLISPFVRWDRAMESPSTCAQKELSNPWSKKATTLGGYSQENIRAKEFLATRVCPANKAGELYRHGSG